VRQVLRNRVPKAGEVNPLCDIDSISPIQAVPDGMPNGSNPLTCVVGLNNAYYFTVETPVKAHCLDVLKSEIERSPSLTSAMQEHCEWGYLQNPDANNSVYFVATCEGDTDLGKTSPDNGYAVLNWKKADPNVIQTDFGCRN
jgi:hypothetical protein